MSEPNTPNAADEVGQPQKLQTSRRADLPLPTSVVGWLRLWFGLRDEVGRRAYWISGFGLMLFKYAAEATVISLTCGKFYSPLYFLLPVYSLRTEALQGGPQWLQAALLVWSLVFLWIALGMSIRRAADAGRSPWDGLCVLIPFLNLIVMLGLSALPSAPKWQWRNISERNPTDGVPTRLWSGVRALFLGLITTFVMIGLTVYIAGNYGAALFFASPTVVCAVTAFAFNRPVARSLAATLSLSFQLMVVVFAAMLLFALEGLICLMMAAPIVLVCGLLGALIGKAIADFAPHSEETQFHALLALPLLAMLEPHFSEYPLREIVSTVEIDAPPQVVWQNVVSFPDLPDDREWYFRLGIACPERARIDGTGVGAVRYCIFSTGEFVEPITVWDEPHRLAFDVTRQPHTMKELSPYRHVYAPHLGGTLQSRRGEFLLIELPNGRTRLEGRTWYDFAMSPQPYWTLWSDSIIRAIHRRVLNHIQQRSEQSPEVQEAGDGIATDAAP